jgi:hypothetical protein
VYRGHPLDEALRRERITRSELEAAVRDGGLGAVASVVPPPG